MPRTTITYKVLLTIVILYIYIHIHTHSLKEGAGESVDTELQSPLAHPVESGPGFILLQS